MNFTIEQSIDQLKLFIKDDTNWDSEISITKYTISFNAYLETDIENVYTYETISTSGINNIGSGVYLDITNFVNNTEAFSTTLIDDAYTFDIEVTYDTDLLTDQIDTTSITKLFYQGILNTYSQIHLNYDWTRRYKEDTKELLQVAEELTWVDSLRLASENLGRPETFKNILSHLQNYFTLEYDY